MATARLRTLFDLQMKKDIYEINARSDVSIKTALRNQIIWIGAIPFLAVGAADAIVRL